jgi:hypothetical protein
MALTRTGVELTASDHCRILEVRASVGEFRPSRFNRY